MRKVLAPLAFLSMPAFAADIPVDSRVTAATVFPAGAALTREATFDAPAGRHQLILSDMPVLDPGGLRVTVAGADMGTVTLRRDFVPPRGAGATDAIAAAEAEVARLEQQLQDIRDSSREIRAEAVAARARIRFLGNLGLGESPAAGVEPLRDIARMVGDEVLLAERAALAAEIRAREVAEGQEDVQDALDRARKALAALDLEAEDRAFLAVSIETDAATTGQLTLRYVTEAASWEPVYQFNLTRKPEPELTIGRGAYVRQATGETWEEVALTLSTTRTDDMAEPGTLYPIQRRIFDQPRPLPRDAGRFANDGAAAPMATAEAGLTRKADASFDGLSVRYDYPRPVTIATGADNLRIALGDLSLAPKITARAVPRLQQTAFLMAEFDNDSGELIAASGASEFYLDGTFTGRRATPLIAEGDEAELGFGPIEGIRLERRVLDRSEGDRGVIARTNRLVEEVEIEVRNLTGDAWDLRLLDQVPYSEQEDLQVDFTAVPPPTERDVDGRRGVLAWDIALAPRTTETVRLSHTLVWPEDKILQ